jgi:hypothetical protein
MDDGWGSGVDITSTRLLIDGIDVTKNAVVTPHFVTYQPSNGLPPGRHTAQLAVGDNAGNHASQSWAFLCDGLRPAMSFTSNRRSRYVALKSGESLDLTLRAQPGGTAFATVAAARIPLNETAPGIYTGRIECAAGVNVQNATVTAHFTGADHANTIANLSQTVSIGSTKPMPPQISSPLEGQQIGANLQIAGLSSPDSTVDICIGYTSKALGIIDITGTAAQTQAVADNNGRWETDKISLATPGLVSPHNTGLTITATSVDALGQRSPASSVRVLLQ